MNTFISINPRTGEEIARYLNDDDESLENKLHQSSAAFNNWRCISFNERAKYLIRVADILKRNKVVYAQLIHEEMGKVIPEAIAEIQKCAKVCEYYAENAEDFLKDEVLRDTEDTAKVSYQPLGTILAIMPWNFPFWQVFRYAVPALMAGNVCLLKHAPNVGGCTLAIEQIFREADLPRGCFQHLFVGHEVMEEVISDSRIAAVTLTGSERAGSAVASLAGKYLKKTVLELGGSDPFIVLEDADLDTAVKEGVKSRMLNTGQSCIAAKRFIVMESVYDEFLIKLTNAIANLEIDKDYSCLARVDLAETIEKQVNKSIELGAILHLGGERKDAYYAPTILTHISLAMPAYNEELFGPVVSLIKVADEREAVSVANDTMYGLGASIWTANKERGKALAASIQSGAVFINRMVASDPRIPFGGIKQSGYGRELSLLGIREFVNIQSVVG